MSVSSSVGGPIGEEGAVGEPGRPETVLEEASRLVMGNRQADYGHPRVNFKAIADLFTAYLRGTGFAAGTDLTAVDAAQLMLLVKVARVATGGTKRDTVVDQAGYAEVTALIVGLDEM